MDELFVSQEAKAQASTRTFHWVTYPNTTTTTPVAHSGPFEEFLEEILDPRNTRTNKRDCPLFQCVIMSPGTSRGTSSIRYHTALVGDYDEGEIPMGRARDILEAYQIQAFFYESYSSTEDHPKWRMVLPLATPVTPEEMRVGLAKINQLLLGVFSAESFVSAQAYFYGWKTGKERSFLTPRVGLGLGPNWMTFELSFLDKIQPLYPVLTRAEQKLGRRLFPWEVEKEIQEAVDRKKGKLGTGEGRTELLKGYLVALKRQDSQFQATATLTRAAHRIVEDYFVEPGTMQPERLVDWVMHNIQLEPRSVNAREAFLSEEDETPSSSEPKLSAWRTSQVDIASEVGAVEFIIDGFLPAGLNLIAAPHGVGKTTNLVPLALVAAGLLDFPGVTAEIRRKVVVFAEDPEQVKRIIKSCLKGSEKLAELQDWIYLIKSKRKSPSEVKKILKDIDKDLSYTDAKGYPIKPWVIFDTASANFETENENDNSEIGRFADVLKLVGLPVLVVGHTSKMLLRAEAEDMTFRGASAWEADAGATFFLFHDEDIDKRVLIIKKRRFVPTYEELHFGSTGFDEVLEPPWVGQNQRVVFNHGVPEVGNKQDRKEAKAEAKEERADQAKESKMFTKQQEVMAYIIEKACRGELVTKKHVREALTGRKAILAELVDRLVDSGQVQALDIPEDLRPPRFPKDTKALAPADLAPEDFFGRVRELEKSRVRAD